MAIDPDIDPIDSLLRALKAPERDALERQSTADFPVLDFLQAEADDWLWDQMAAYRPRRARKPRRPSLGRIMKEARKAGATEITTPDGYTLKFGPEPAETANPWLADLDKMTRQ
jgi:hypothetical protein